MRIAVVGPSETAAEWDVLRAVGERIATENDRVTISYYAPRNRTPAAQQAILDKVRASDVHAVCLFPIDPLAIRTHVASLVLDGKPVVLIGLDSAKSQRAVFVGPSELKLGEAAATACARVMPRDRRTVMLLHAGSDHAVYGARYAAFRSQLRHETAAEMFKELDCRADGVEAQRIIRRQSRLYPRLGCWAILDDWPLRRLPAGDRLVPLGCSLVVCRDDPVYFAAMRRGEIDALVVYDMYEAVDRALRATVRVAEDRADEVLDRILIAPEIITDDRLDWHEKRWARWRRGLPSLPVIEE